MWTRNVVPKSVILSASGILKKEHVEIKRQVIRALNKDGEIPANQTNRIIVPTFNNKPIFFNADLFSTIPAIEEIKERCIPDNARICDNHECLKVLLILESRYSFEPDNNASKNPPALPQSFINRLNVILQ